MLFWRRLLNELRLGPFIEKTLELRINNKGNDASFPNSWSKIWFSIVMSTDIKWSTSTYAATILLRQTLRVLFGRNLIFFLILFQRIFVVNGELSDECNLKIIQLKWCQVQKMAKRQLNLNKMKNVRNREKKLSLKFLRILSMRSKRRVWVR